MAGGEDTGNHPGRKADNWRPVTGLHSNPRGQIVSRMTAGVDHYPHQLEVTHHTTDSGPGFSAGLDFVANIDSHGVDTRNYLAGPYRTQHRAEVAGRALLDRAEADDAGTKASEYQIGEYHESAEEIRLARQGLI